MYGHFINPMTGEVFALSGIWTARARIYLTGTGQ
jgi:hypothetical protein